MLGEEDEGLGMFPLTVLGTLKHPLFNLRSISGFNPYVDHLNVLKVMVPKMSFDELSLHMMPNIFAVHSLQPEECIYDEDGVFAWPAMLGLNFDSISDEEGIYLLDDGIQIFLFVSYTASPDQIRAIFGVESADEIITPIDENEMMPDE